MSLSFFLESETRLCEHLQWYCFEMPNLKARHGLSQCYVIFGRIQRACFYFSIRDMVQNGSKNDEHIMMCWFFMVFPHSDQSSVYVDDGLWLPYLDHLGPIEEQWSLTAGNLLV